MTFPFPTAERPWLLWEGDCLLGMAEIPENSIDAVVTDPPYFLGFMGKAWDGAGAGAKPMDFYEFTVAWARYAYSVMKPGAYLIAFASSRTYHRMACGIEDVGFEIRDQLMWLYGTGFPKNADTHLKPAHEPMVLARKPMSESTLEANVSRWGTGALNIEPCRIEFSEELEGEPMTAGRYPPNVLMDANAAQLLDAQTGVLTSGTGTVKRSSSKGTQGNALGRESRPSGMPMIAYGDSGGASRFFYCSKASKKERGGSKHPTVKPVDVMRWLCRLVTPPGGLVLDPFAGTGTTAQAAIEEGLRAILCEREQEYIVDINRRLETQ